MIFSDIAGALHEVSKEVIYQGHYPNGRGKPEKSFSVSIAANFTKSQILGDRQAEKSMLIRGELSF
jgi:hypothetical protein